MQFLELVDIILENLVDEYNSDPVYQWTTLRHISARQKRRIEKHFLEYWVPKLTITLYLGSWVQVDYKSAAKASNSDCEDGIVHFQAPEGDLSDHFSQERLATLWQHYGFENRVAHLRLGEGVLNGGIREGHIVNDTELVGLKVGEDSNTISFDWKQTMDALLREEMLMRKFQSEMMSQRIQKLAKANQWPSSPAEQRVELVKQLVLDIQMRKRVEVQKHRLDHHDPNGSARLGSLSEESAYLHKQPTPPSTPSGVRTACCSICSRQSGPSIFEVASQEESVVLALDGWQQLDADELLGLYGEAFGWGCCRCQRKEGDLDWQRKRKNQWMKVGSGTAKEKLFNQTCVRWDPLG
ncbi:hypothetical protein DL764_003776 [Monosporascus ibericus]|uniref:Uncharacterized protein n=1 Tax=Monosporascus ibericus TaxID=155417 RepID=A0A4Q4TFB4_9PEZI|nr:hypothetical protein DL764_003776 [Monosporascus ibericus]